MTFGSDHYVPVVKVKRGEKLALRILATRLRSQITPLLEIVECKPTNHLLDISIQRFKTSGRAYAGTRDHC